MLAASEIASVGAGLSTSTDACLAVSAFASGCAWLMFAASCSASVGLGLSRHAFCTIHSSTFKRCLGVATCDSEHAA